MANLELTDYHWLTSDAAARLLQDLQEKLAGGGQVDVRLAASLRKSHSATRTHLLLEQVELRGRARDKFVQPDQMFFTRKALEQCTDERLARYKAQRFTAGSRVADLCCGIGGDALSLAARGPVTGWDADQVTAHFAVCNLAILGHSTAEVKHTLANSKAVREVAAWHIDPDRRATGERAIQLADYEPGPAFLTELLQTNPNGAVKVAPAADVNPSEWPTCEREWLGSRGECRQQILWFGNLARQAGQHVATALAGEGHVHSYSGLPDVTLAPADDIRAYVYEPDATILAAQLAGAFAAEHQLSAITAGGGYLTSEHLVQHPMLSTFRVREVMPYDLRKLKAYCREHRLGQLEIKKRGVELQPHHVRRQIIGAGDESAVILITQHADHVKAIVAERSGSPTRERGSAAS